MQTVEINKLDHYGRGIGKINDKIIFIPYTLPGDTVDVAITKEKKNFLEGTVVKFIKKSSEHIINNCPYYEKCGGCQLRHMSYDKQLLFKEEKLREIISKFVKEEVKINKIIPCENENYYRNKLSLKVINNKLGFNSLGTHNIIPIDECMLADRKINNVIKFLNEQNLSGIDNVMIRSSLTNDDIMVYLDGKNCQIDTNKLKKYVTSIALHINNKNEQINKKGNIIENLKNKKYKISNLSFFQVNTSQTVKLYDLILEKSKLTGNEILYDLYCGTGTIGLYLSSKCKKVIGIEIIEAAIEDAKENAKINNISNCIFYAGDVSKIINKMSERADIIVVDPPRNGLDNSTIQNIFRLNPIRIVYTSCDPITLARDLNILKEKYNIIDITPVDMFPNTYHVESVCVLERN